MDMLVIINFLSGVTTQMGFGYCNSTDHWTRCEKKLNSEVFLVLLSPIPMVMGVA